MAEEKEVKPKKAAKVKEEKVIPELSGAALVLKENLSYETATTRLQQFNFKYELKEYKRSKDVKFKIKSFKGLENSGFNFSDPDEETNSYLNEEDATYGLLAHIGFNLTNEANYNLAIKEGKDQYHEKIVYSTKEDQSILGEVGTPIGKEKIPALSFVQMLKYESHKPEQVKVKGFDDYLEDALAYSKVAKKFYIDSVKEENKKKLEAEKAEKLRNEEFLRKMEEKNSTNGNKKETKVKQKAKPKI